MKTTKILFAATLFAGAALFSCSKDQDPPRKTDDGPKAAVFRSSIDSRASNTTWTANDDIGIAMVSNADRTAIVDETTNRQYRTSAAGATGNFAAVGATNQIYFPEDGTDVDFIAYYPFKTNVEIAASATAIGTYPVDVFTQTSAEAIDLMWANTTAGYDETTVTAVPLVFDHQLTKLVMNCTAGSGLVPADLVGMTVTINGMNTTQNYNLTTGALIGTSASQRNFAPRTVTDGSAYEAIILPAAATTASGQFNVTFTIDPTGTPETFTWDMASGTTFLARNQYTYNVTISRVGVTATGTINPWTANTPEDVTAQ